MKTKFLFVALMTLLSATAQAASDGTVGATSTGTSLISVTLPKLIVARSFADFALGTYAGTGAYDVNDDLNIATNYGTAARTYGVTATGSGTASAFTLTSGLATIAYTPLFNDATGVVGRVALTTGVNLTTQGAAVKPLATATLNANLSIQITQANLQAVDAGAYTGTITIVFNPE